jgi:hypothetical protein
MRMFRSKALELNTDAARDSYVSPMVFAGLQATLGDKDKAFSWLARADTERSSKLLDLKVDPDFDSLRGDPRFTELVRHSDYLDRKDVAMEWGASSPTSEMRGEEKAAILPHQGVVPFSRPYPLSHPRVDTRT